MSRAAYRQHVLIHFLTAVRAMRFIRCCASDMSSPPTYLAPIQARSPPTCPPPAVQILDHVADKGGHDTFYGQVRLLACNRPTRLARAFMRALADWLARQLS